MGTKRSSTEETINTIRRKTCRKHRKHSAEEKIRLMEGSRGEDSIAELCRREGSAQRPVLQME